MAYGNELKYFSKNYQCRTRGLFPQQCARCKIRFCDKKPKDCEEGKEWTVKAGAVYLCPLGAKSSHECVFGYCGKCMEEEGGMQRTKRVVRPTRKCGD